ncbi:MAG: prolyl oligopeptidase family serine peptidase [Candidatus Dependentiae bacterium]
MIPILLVLAIFIASPVHTAAQHARSLLLTGIAPVVRTAGRSSMRVPYPMVQLRAKSALAASGLHLPVQTQTYGPRSQLQQSSFNRQMPMTSSYVVVGSSAYQNPAQGSQVLSPEAPSLLQKYQDQKLFPSYENFLLSPEESILDEVVQAEENKTSNENKKYSSMLVSKNKYIPEAFDELDDLQKKMVRSEENYQKYLERYKNLKDVDVKKIKYKVDGHEVEGFILLPKNTDAKKHPLVLYSRGGHRDYGKIDLMTVMDQMIYLAQNGYAVLASQYRGSIDKKVADEFGGKEVADNIKLLELAEEMDVIDMSNIFLVAFSRGSIMAYRTIQELKNRLPIKAYVGIGGASDVKSWVEENPRIVKPLLEDALGQNFTDNFIEESEKRSISEYPEIMDEIPMLLMHAGGQRDGQKFEDPIVPTNQSIKLDNLLTERKESGDRKAEHELILYPERAHVLNKYNDEVKEQILKFLAKYR